jgi:hypothetical protein
MNLLPRFRRLIGLALVIAVACAAFGLSVPARAGTTGNITGTITDADTGAPVVNAAVAASSPSGARATTTDQKGFYVLQALNPDNYTVSVQADAYGPAAVAGIVVQQDLTLVQDFKLNKALKTIASVKSRSGGTLVKPNVTSDAYTVSGAQLNAISGGNNLHKTLYQYIATIPGITGSGFPAQPRVHGGSAADISYEFDGIPINDPVSGLFTTNLSNVGIGNVEVFTGGLDASQAGSGLGIVNTVVKTGTYPGFGDFSYGSTPRYRNLYETLEYGGATQNGRFNWFFSADNTNALNQFVSGQTYPGFLIQQANGPGVVKTTDLTGNFHFKPTSKDDIQLLIQNGLGEFNWGYLMQRAPGEPVPLTAVPCPGYVASTTTYSGGIGGTAPNGATCPLGFYFGTAATQQAGGNYWHHYSGIGKVQWNHIINDHSFVTMKLTENFNQYIFDQPVVDANLPQFENPGTAYGALFRAGCPLYPYAAGTPIMVSTKGVACDLESTYFSTGFWEERKSHIYQATVDYSNIVGENTSFKVGFGQEYVPDATQNVFYTQFFNADGTWPAINYLSGYPLHIPYIYAQADLKRGKLLLSPGIRYQREYYDIPGGNPISSGLWTPTFAFNYAFNANQVIRGSYTDSSSFPTSYVIYRNVPRGALNGTAATTPYCGPTNNGNGCGFSPNATIHHSLDLQYERQIDANTSIKVGPYYDTATNIYENYTPYTCSSTNPPNCVASGPQVPYSGGIRKGFGIELGVNHLDNRTSGISWWIAGTYDNFWTNTTSSLLTPYGTTPIPPLAVARGNLLRSSLDPFLSGTLTLDIHHGDLSLFPLLYLQGPSIFYTGPSPNTKTGAIAYVTNQTTGYGILNLTAEMRTGRNRDLIFGIAGTNVLNNNRPTLPCTPSNNRQPLGLGCSPYFPVDGTNQAGVTGSGFQYANTNQSSPLFMFFITKKF